MNTRDCIYRGILALFVFATSHTAATASTIWTDWTQVTVGDPGSATGTLGSTTVSYSGEVIGAAVQGGTIIDGTSAIWNPESTYVGGVVDVSPAVVGDVIGLDGSTNRATISFSTPVANPVIAIWSLGSPVLAASFTFDQAPVLQAGGPNSIYGGSSIVVNGNTVSGNEGNGVILFNGEVSSISFTSTNEHWYGFTVGTAVVPVPAALWLFGSGLVGLLGIAGRKKTT